MKRKKNHPDKFQPDRYRDGPKKPVGPKQPRRVWDDENLDEALEEWETLRRHQQHMGSNGEEE